MGIVRYGEISKRYINQNIGLFGLIAHLKGGVKELQEIYKMEFVISTFCYGERYYKQTNRLIESINKLEDKPNIYVVTDSPESITKESFVFVKDISEYNEKYKNYIGINEKESIKVCFDCIVNSGDLKIGTKEFNYNTLEPLILKENGLDKLNIVFNKSFNDLDEMHKFMKANKTECALKIFDSTENIKFPQYILDAIKD
jgi:hypothetical protein